MEQRPRPLGGVALRAVNPSFWRGRRVLLTGHTGFKGGWLAIWLMNLGARVDGYGLEPDTKPSFFERSGLRERIASTIADIRDRAKLHAAIESSQPEIVLHLAAQSLVRRSYEAAHLTFETNVMGTINLLESVRASPSVKVIVIVTSDKCYSNREWPWAYREDDPLGGRDPYSASKACAEIAAEAYRCSFFQFSRGGIGLATARAGNVIGGGDWATDRLVPDTIRALEAGVPLVLRNPSSVRPWQHVLEPLAGYLLLAESLYCDPARFSGAYNFGPSEGGEVSTSEIADLAVKVWGNGSWKAAVPGEAHGAPHEARYLRLDAGKARQVLGWRPRLRLEQALEMTLSWYRESSKARDMFAFSSQQIAEYQRLIESTVR